MMDGSNEIPLYQRLKKLRSAVKLLAFTLITIVFIALFLCYLSMVKASSAAFLNEGYYFLAFFIFIVAISFLIPGILLARFGKHQEYQGKVANYQFKSLRNALIFLAVITGIMASISFFGGSAILIDEIDRYLR